MEAIVIPVKRLEAAKLRLATALEPDGRRHLGLGMLADVLRATEKWSGRFIVTSDVDAEAIGIAFGCQLIPDPGNLNDAVADGIAAAVEAGAETVLVLPSDVPLVTPDDVSRMFSEDVEVVVAVSPDGGTNALRLRPPGVIRPSFGDESARLHAEAASEAGATVRLLTLDSLRLDVDDPEDLRRLAKSDSARQSVLLARQLFD